MKCPFCEKEGKRSKVYIGMTKTTLLGFFSYYDEDGILQVNSPNTLITDYICSNRHKFRIEKIEDNEIIFENKEIGVENDMS